MSELTANTPNQCLFARAMYDNIAEAPDELAFRKGDVLSVLEQNTTGLDGWWMCTLRGRQGICPGNRLKIVDAQSVENGVQQLGSHRTSRNSAMLHIRYDVPQNCNSDYATLSRASFDAERIGSYDVPPRAMSVLTSSAGSSSPASSCYEVPRPQPCSENSLTPSRFESPLGYYNEPRPSSTQSRRPRSSVSSLANDNSLGGSNRSTFIGPDYDVPRSNASLNLSARLPTPKTTPPPMNVYDVPVSKEAYESELEMLQKLQAESLSAVNCLLEFVNPTWNSSEQNSIDFRHAILKIRSSMQDLAEFAEGTFANAEKAPDKCTATRLRSLVNSMRDNDKLVQQIASNLGPDGQKSKIDSGSDSMNSFDQMVVALTNLSEDVRQLVSFMQINATLLFDRANPPSSNNNNNGINENNDTKNNNLDSNNENSDNGYVNLNLTSKIKPRDEVWDCYDTKEIEAIQLPPMEPKDKQLLTYYTAQIITHTVHLTNAIDTFLQTVERNQPPKMFLASAKFVLMKAHRLVHIYDTLCGSQVCRYVKPKLVQCCNALYATLAETVSTTKQAALFFPSVSAVQAMVDSVVDISNFATDIKITMIHIIQQL